MRELGKTTGMCPLCGKTAGAVIYEDSGRVVMEKRCIEHGVSTALISSDAAWYERVMGFPARIVEPAKRLKEISRGCPFDCGHCGAHAQRTYMPVIPVTSACNLDCRVCYTINKNEEPYNMTEAEFAAILTRMREAGPEMQIINFTGGEPLMHPNFVNLVKMSKEAGVKRITVSTNGLRLLERPELLPRLLEYDTRFVFSFNSFKEEPYKLMGGGETLERKLKLLEMFAENDAAITLLAVTAAGINDKEIGDITSYVMQSDNIVSAEIHTVTFSGENGADFCRETRLTTPDIIKDIVRKVEGARVEDFLPSPCAHPLCYSVCYFLRLPGGAVAPFTSFMPESDIIELLTGNLYVEPGQGTERILVDAMNAIWSRADTTARDKDILAGLDNLVRSMFPRKTLDIGGRIKAAERLTKAVYIHSHMDADNLDTERLGQCCIAVPDSGGGYIPTCAYNNVHRARDSRFSKKASGRLS